MSGASSHNVVDLTGSTADFKVCLPGNAKVELLVAEGGQNRVLATVALTVQKPDVRFVSLAESVVKGNADSFIVQVLNLVGGEVYDVRVWLPTGSEGDPLGFDKPVENEDGSFTCSGLSKTGAGISGADLLISGYEVTAYGCVVPGGYVNASVSYDGNVVGLATATFLRVSGGPPRQKPSMLEVDELWGNRGIEVTWESDVPDATSYLVTVSPGDRYVNIETELGRAVVTGLKPKRSYTVEVRGVNAGGRGPAAGKIVDVDDPTHAWGHLPGHVVKFDRSGVGHDGIKAWVLKAAKLWNGRMGSRWKMCDDVEIACPSGVTLAEFPVKTVAPKNRNDSVTGCGGSVACVRQGEVEGHGLLADRHLVGGKVLFENPAYACLRGGVSVCPNSLVVEYVWTNVRARHKDLVPGGGQPGEVVRYLWTGFAALHEMGHTLGLPDFYRYSDLDDLPAVMNTFEEYSTQADSTVREEDLLQLRAIYARHERH